MTAQTATDGQESEGETTERRQETSGDDIRQETTGDDRRQETTEYDRKVEKETVPTDRCRKINRQREAKVVTRSQHAAINLGPDNRKT